MPRPALLLLPGLLCDARLWRDQVAALRDAAECRVADLTRDDSLDAMVDRAVRDMPERFAVCGLSMGGYVALALMRRAPERVTHLCLMDTGARPDTPEQARRRRGLMALIRSGRGAFRGVAPRLLPQLLHPDRAADPVLGAEVIAMAERVGRDAYLRQQTAILGRPDSRPDLSGIAVPTLVAVGEGDQLTPPELSREMAAAIPGARPEVLAGCGHLPPMEDPARVSALLWGWLAGDRAPGGGSPRGGPAP